MFKKHFFSALIFILAIIVLTSCSLQKRHYRNGFYSENFFSKSMLAANRTEKKTTHSFQEKLYNDITENSNQVLLVSNYSAENKITAVANSQREKTNFVKNKKIIASVSKKTSVAEELDPDRNNVARAGFRMSIYSLLFLGGALYAFSLSIPVYFVLGLMFIAFLFALISLITSISAGKDRGNTNRKGLRYSRFGVIVSLLIICAIAAFFIFTPIIF